MNGGDDLARSPGRPSVRVEMDAPGDSPVSAPDPTVGPRSIRRVTAVLIGLIVVVACIIPFEGGAAALKTQRPLMHLMRGACVVTANTIHEHTR